MREFVVAKRKRDDDTDRDVRLAWSIAALQRQKKLPSLQSLLNSSRKRLQTVDEQRAMLEILSGKYGGALRKHTKETRGR